MREKHRREELAHILRSRRERLSPDSYPLPPGPKKRRTPGLRREELAHIAGISPTWYTKLEQGQPIHVSEQVLESLSKVLGLTSGERAHLYALAREHLPLPEHSSVRNITTELQGVLDAVSPNPAIILNDRWDIIGWNRAASLVFVDYALLDEWERNFVWLMFTRPDQRELFIEWEHWASMTLALFRKSGSHGVGNTWFEERRDRLMSVSNEFAMWWEQHEVSDGHMGHKILRHPQAGILHLQSTALRVVDTPELNMFLFTALPMDNTYDKLVELVDGAMGTKYVK